MSAYAAQIDYLTIMYGIVYTLKVQRLMLPTVSRNYDVWGASSTPGPNAPLGKSPHHSTSHFIYLDLLLQGNPCGTSTQPLASAEAAFAQFTAAKFPASKVEN